MILMLFSFSCIFLLAFGVLSSSDQTPGDPEESNEGSFQGAIGNAMEATGDAIGIAARATGHAVSIAAKATSDAVSIAAKASGDAVSEAVNSTGNAVGAASKATGDAVSHAISATREFLTPSKNPDEILEGSDAIGEFVADSKASYIDAAQARLDAIEKKWQEFSANISPIVESTRAELRITEHQIARILVDAKAMLIKARDTSIEVWQNSLKQKLNASLLRAEQLYENTIR